MGLERDDPVSPGERRLGRSRVAALPVVDAVRRLAFLVVADEHRAVLQRLLRRRDDGQDVVVDVDELECVLGDVRVGGDDCRDFLALESHFVGREHRLRVTRQGRHPREVVLREQLTGDHRDDSVERGRRRRVDALDARVRHR